MPKKQRDLLGMLDLTLGSYSMCVGNKTMGVDVDSEVEGTLFLKHAPLPLIPMDLVMWHTR